MKSVPSGSASSHSLGAALEANQRVGSVLGIAVGSVLAVLALLADPILDMPLSFGPAQLVLLLVGVVFVAAAFFQRIRFINRLTVAICLPLLSLVLLLGAGEVLLRAIGFDFANEAKAWREIPPFFRQPTVPTGTVFFRRHGPDRWEGRVLHTFVSKSGLVPNGYENEAPIVVDYDDQGFRNPRDLKSWNIVVVGDSFTELGQLPYDQLFTTILARNLATTVRNLGTSYTGPLTQISYLEDYGVSNETEQAIIVFFEGNDLGDLHGEYAALKEWRVTRQRSYREFKKQSSLARFLYQQLNHVAARWMPRPYERNVVTAYFTSPHGRVPVTLVPPDAPPGKSTMGAELLSELDYFVAQFARFGKERQLKLWLAYMPSKLRVLHGGLEFSAETLAKLPQLKKLEAWTPSDLPVLMAELCERYGVGFVDLTPALRKEMHRTGKLPFNALNDTHLNSFGASVVGTELARRVALREEVAK